MPFKDRMNHLENPSNREHLAALAAQPSPVRWAADWPSQFLFEIYAPENLKYRGRKVVELPRRKVASRLMYSSMWSFVIS